MSSGLFKNPGSLTGPALSGPVMSQSQVLTALGIPRSQWAQIEGSGIDQRTVNQLANARGFPEPFNPSFASSLIQDLIPLAAPLALAGAAGELGAGGAAAADAGEAAGGASLASKLGTVAKVGGGLAGADLAFQDASGFFSLISWLFHPINWLRAFEVILGIFIFYVGVKGSSRLLRGNSNANVRPTPIVRNIVRKVVK